MQRARTLQIAIVTSSEKDLPPMEQAASVFAAWHPLEMTALSP